MKRNLLLLPIPPRRSAAEMARLRAAGELVVAKEDLANAQVREICQCDDTTRVESLLMVRSARWEEERQALACRR